MTGIFRTLKRDERGNAPALVVGGAAVFTIVSVGVASGLITGLVTAGLYGRNAALEDAAYEALYADTARGYSHLTTLPDSAEITLHPDERTEVVAHRQVEKNPSARTARVTITVSRTTDIGYADCAPADGRCFFATELVADVGSGL